MGAFKVSTGFVILRLASRKVCVKSKTKNKRQQKFKPSIRLIAARPLLSIFL